MKASDDPHDLIWFIPALFALFALFIGAGSIYALYDDQIREQVGVFTPICVLIIIAIRGVGYWHFLKRRKYAIPWLVAALLVSMGSAIVAVLRMGAEVYFAQNNPISLIIGYAVSIGVLVYAFELRQNGILK